jgi:hypothetical protein
VVLALFYRAIRRAVCGVALFIAPAHADDGAAALAAGGLIFVKAPGIVMQREDLTLSAPLIRVRFEMRNDRAEAATLRVAFPLPDVPLMTPGGWETQSRAHVVLPDAVTDPRFIDFTVSVNGRAVQPELEVRAVLPDGRDVTDLLREAGGTALLLQPRLFDRDDLTPAVRRRLLDAGAIEPAEPNDPDSPDWAKWATRIRFHWEQIFPPGVTVIEHSYRPLLGFNYLEQIRGHWTGTGAGDLEKAFCIDPATDNGLRRMASPGHPAMGYEVAYILSTAATWDGPIGTFHLTLEGGQMPPGKLFAGGNVTLITLCTGLKLRQTGTLRFEATERDYRPAADLRALFVMRNNATQ